MKEERCKKKICTALSRSDKLMCNVFKLQSELLWSPIYIPFFQAAREIAAEREQNNPFSKQFFICIPIHIVYRIVPLISSLMERLEKHIIHRRMVCVLVYTRNTHTSKTYIIIMRFVCTLYIVQSAVKYMCL